MTLMNGKTMMFAALIAAGVSMPEVARAQDHALHFAQTGALLTYSQAELRILFAAVTAREYDPKATKTALEELKRALGDAKRHAGRTATLLPEKKAKHEAEVEKLRAAISKAEDQLSRLANDIEEQTKPLFADEAEVELGARDEGGDEGGEPATIDWNLLKSGTGWLAVDVKTCQGMYKKLARKLGVRGLKAPPKPRGKRPE